MSRLTQKRHVDIGYCKTQNYGVLSFDEWCEREGIDNPFEDKVVVNVKSQEELDFVSEHLAYQWPEGCFNIYNKDYCIDLHRRRRYADMGYCKEQGYKILSFDEWCKKENISYSYIVNKLKTL